MSLRASKRFRSTKGASKARRDQINAEIRTLRALLPISPEDQQRLPYLHSMALICTFIRKTTLLAGVCDSSSGSPPLSQLFPQALPGFLIALSADGKLLCVSENVSEHLGLSMVDVLQGDSIYEMVDSRDAEALRLMLRDPDESTERSVVCRMLSSKALRPQSCSVLVRGRFLGPSVFVALCSPTVDRLQGHSPTSSFSTLHRPDMRLASAPYSVLFHLGFSAEELIGRSWYSLLHPDDLTLAARCHNTLLGAEGGSSVQMLVRLQRKDLSWTRLYICASVEAAKETITCVNHVVSEVEAVYLREKLYGGTSQGPQGLQGPVCSPDTAGAVLSQAGSVSESGLFCTPPYSPASPLGSELLSEGYGPLEQLVCGPRFCPAEAFSVSGASHPFPAPPVCAPDAHLVPVCRPLDAGECPSDGLLYPEPFMFGQDGLSGLLTPEPSPSLDGPFLYGPQEPSVDGHFLYGPREPSPSPSVDGPFLYGPPRTEVGSLAHQIRSLACSFEAYSSRGLCWPLLDEPVIDSILRDLDASGAKHTACAWSGPPAPGPPVEPQQLHPCLYAAPAGR